ncbi:MAG: ABC transporter substrate-binding protein [Bifidobacteriaceae bacterium]|jgi:oligopeptide transport system substrate-binding protein|nr:ABC transporter substrate-binding protein [Bifidobacteriaceae bacterium]
MAVRKYGVSAVALAAAAALALAGCGTKDEGGSTNKSTGGTTTTSGGVVKLNGTEPQNPLVPTNTNEVGGGRIITNLFAGPVYYTADGATEMDVAESVESDDNITWTIKLKSGQKFSNDEPVNADSFVNAWNYGALGANGQLSADFFNQIKGYDEVNSVTEALLAELEAEGKPVPTMEGLVKVDDLTFTAELTEEDPFFKMRLGYSAFYPLPTSAFDDMAAFGESPVGNGPYKLDGDGAWEHNIEIRLVPNESYQGPRKPVNGGVTYVFYQDRDTAYQDLLSGQLDVLDEMPESALSSFETDLGDRAVSDPGSLFQSFTIPDRLAHFGGEEGKLRRAAISRAIDRESITKTIFQGTRTPAKDFSSPLMEGWSGDIPGNEVLTFGPDKAKELWAQADAISPWEGEFQIAYNQDGPHGVWVEAALNSIASTLGIATKPAPYPTFQESRTAITDRTIQTPFRSGWQPDYPSIYNYLSPLYGTGGGSNDGDYSNPQFDALLVEGISEATPADAAVKFNQAQEILLKDLPAIPLWYQNSSGGYSENVENVIWGWDNVPIAYQITTK